MATSSIRRYKMDHPKRGYLIIIDNNTFPNPKNNLYGSERDVDNYKETFVFKLGFELILRQNQTKNEMIKLMEHFANNVDHLDRDCIMVVFLSHGYTDENQQYFCGVDKGVLLTELTDPFITCQSLDEKPKIFFCDVSRGSEREPDYAKSFHNDSQATPLTGVASSSRSTTPYYSLKDFIFCYGSAHGYVAGKLAKENLRSRYFFMF